MKVTQHHNLVIGGYMLLTSGCLLAPTMADFPKPIAPPKSEGLAPIGPTASPSALPNDIAKPNSKMPVIPAAQRHVPVLIERMMNNQLTPQKAWDEKLLNVDDLLWIFTPYIDPWGSFNWKFNVEVRRELAALLARHYDQKIEPIEKLPPTTRLWLADYYMSVGDQKTTVIGESILKEIKAPSGDEEPLAFQALERMGRYYAANGEYEKGAKTWLRMTDYYTQMSRLIPHSLNEAALLYLQTDHQQKAKALYALLPGYGNDLLNQSALLNQLYWFASKGKTEDIKELFKSPLNIKGSDPNGMRLTELAFLARACYCIGRFDEARKYADEAITFRASLPTPPYAPLLEDRKGMAEEILRWADRWKKASVPVVTDPEEVREFVKPGKPLAFQLAVRSFKSINATVTSDSKKVKVSPVTTQPIQSGLFFSNIVKVEIEPTNVKATLTVRSPQYPELEIRVPVQVEAPQAVEEQETIDVITIE